MFFKYTFLAFRICFNSLIGIISGDIISGGIDIRDSGMIITQGLNLLVIGTVVSSVEFFIMVKISTKSDVYNSDVWLCLQKLNLIIYTFIYVPKIYNGRFYRPFRRSGYSSSIPEVIRLKILSYSG